jgi:methyltransferase-like protein/ubiquinone/menaquinone biosynthesis C-methylase UbiE
MPDPTSPPAAADSSYDEVPYDSHPFAQTHPSRLFTVATLFGLRPTPVRKCRVLELGCAAGGNLIPMADYLPDSEFVGVDLSARQIADGKALVTDLGLKNIVLQHASILDIDAAYGQFDYVICHGVYSWVPNPVREKILDICAKLMTPNGVAYISYNTYPGWHMRGMIRDMMRYHSSRFNKPKDQVHQSRLLLDFLAQSVKQEGAYSFLLKQELETLRQQADHYLYHEHLEAVNDPVYFHQFIDKAVAKGLKYLGEARIGTMVTGNFGVEVEKTLRMLAGDQIQMEQYMDFLRNRMFRESLLCLEKAQPNWSINPDAVRALHAASGAVPVTADGQRVEAVDLTSEEPQNYRTTAGMSVTTTRPLMKAVMAVLAEAYPGTVPFDTLRTQARARVGDTGDPLQANEDAKMLAMGILTSHLSSDLIELHGMPLAFARAASDKPVATPLARLLAPKGVIPNRRHEVVRLNELDRHLIPLLDGTHDAAALTEKLAVIAQTGAINVNKEGQPLTDPAAVREALGSIMRQAMDNVARMAVLEG